MMKYKEKVEREEVEGKEKPKPKNKPIFDRRPQETEKMFFNRFDIVLALILHDIILKYLI